MTDTAQACVLGQSPQEIQRLREECLAAIEPLRKLLIDVHMYAMPSFIIHADGSMETMGDGLSDQQRQLVGQIHSAIQDITDMYKRKMRL